MFDTMADRIRFRRPSRHCQCGIVIVLSVYLLLISFLISKRAWTPKFLAITSSKHNTTDQQQMAQFSTGDLTKIERDHGMLLKCTGLKAASDNDDNIARTRWMDAYEMLKSRPYLSTYKNPCWTVNHWFPSTQLGSKLRKQEGTPTNVQCVPYGYIIGMPKCATTDLYNSLLKHPHIVGGSQKEPNWWSMKGGGSWGPHSTLSVQQYVRTYNLAAKKIANIGKLYHPAITIDASSDTMWELDRWPLLPGNQAMSEPRVTAAHFLHAAVPTAKILVILRNPTERLFSHYFHRCSLVNFTPSLLDFHQRVQDAIQSLEHCFKQRPVRACVYDGCLNHLKDGTARVALRAGLYSVYLNDWLQVIPSSHIRVLRYEDYVANKHSVIAGVLEFLGMEPMSEDAYSVLGEMEPANPRREDFRALGPMLEETRILLETFYEPFNTQLTELLRDTAFLWRDTPNRTMHSR